VKRLLVILVGLIVLASCGALVYLAGWDIPAPTKRIERVIPSDRLGR
jgi:hypothetical protein